jgi:hypothetical protein
MNKISARINVSTASNLDFFSQTHEVLAEPVGFGPKEIFYTYNYFFRISLFHFRPFHSRKFLIYKN